MALKLKFVNGRGSKTYKAEEVKKEHKEDAKADKETVALEEDEKAPVLLVTKVNNIMHSNFSNVEVYINNQQIYNFNGLYARKSYITNNFKGAIFEYKGILHCEGFDYEEFPDQTMEAPLSEFFSQRERKCLVDPMASGCMVNWG